MKILGIFRGFPGLGRVVSGVSLLEELRDKYNCEVKAISYLQGKKYLRQRGFSELQEVSIADYCSIGLLPTNKMGVYIHSTIKSFEPDLIILDGEPLILQSIKISYPSIKVVVLLNPSDVDNPYNDKEAMDYFNTLYSMADLAIVHGLRRTSGTFGYNNIISIPTILRKEIISYNGNRGNNIYCVLGGGTVNSNQEFIDSSIRIAELCIEAARSFSDREIHIICSCDIIASKLYDRTLSSNVIIHENVLSPNDIYSDAAIIITRSGRNTLSEVAYLGLPTVSFIAGDQYRKEEQHHNINSLNLPNIQTATLESSPQELFNKIVKLGSITKTNNCFLPGNRLAINAILNILKPNETYKNRFTL